MRIEQLPIERDKLGEGPFWDHRIGALYWVDHLGPTVRRFIPVTGEHREWLVPKMIGSAGLTEDRKRLILALSDCFSVLDLETGACEEVASVPQERAAIRLSDGRCDRMGGFVVGSAVTDFAGYEGAIYRLNPDFSVNVLRTGLMLSNAICFQPDGKRMHFTDTRSGIVMVCDYGPETPLACEPQPFADARDHGASPDGATVDSEGGLWVAQIRTGDIARFNSDGSFDRKIELPVPYATSVCFGGADLDILYVTTVRETGMQIRSDHPQAGAVFAIHDLGYRGVEEGVFGVRNGN
ncbi:MAG TPA: SMP-30/gluconolactonase/LRE family protein [Paraburkholderia sp.]